MEVSFESPSPGAYCRLRDAVGWPAVSERTVEEAFAGSLAIASIVEQGELRAFARVVGDGALFLYLQDLMVAPEYQRRGLGTAIVKKLLDAMPRAVLDDAFVGLLAMPGTESFYRQLGFVGQTPDHTVMQLPLSQGATIDHDEHSD